MRSGVVDVVIIIIQIAVVVPPNESNQKVPKENKPKIAISQTRSACKKSNRSSFHVPLLGSNVVSKHHNGRLDTPTRAHPLAAGRTLDTGRTLHGRD